MKKVLLFFSLVAMAFNAYADNYVTIEDVRVCPGRSAEVVVKYHFDSSKICAYQFDLQLPQGVTMDLSSAENGSSAPSTFIIGNNDLGNNHYRYATFSWGNGVGNEPITDNDGVLLTFKVNADNTLTVGSEYDANAYELIFPEYTGTQYDLTDVLFKILPTLLGDVNADGVVNIADYDAVADYILGMTPNVFVKVAANVYDDNNINVADYSGIADIILNILNGNNGNNSKSMMKSPKKDVATNVDNLDNALYIEPVATRPGKQQVLSIKMKNQGNVGSFQVDLGLPEGITFATDENGDIMAEVSTERTTAKRHGLLAAIQEDGTLRLLCSSSTADPSTGYRWAFSGNDGEVARVTIIVPEDYEEGDYALYLKNGFVKDVNTNANAVEVEPFESTLTIDKNAGFVDLAETEEVAPEDANSVDARVYRTFTDGEWSTICLPFAMNEEQVEAAFGEGTEIGEFADWETVENEDEDIVFINLIFDTVTEMEANYPYIIKTTSAKYPFIVEGVNIAADEVKAEVRQSSRRKSYMKGTYVANTTVPADDLFLSGNKFWYSTGKTKMKAFRAYFEVYDKLASRESAGAKIFINYDGNPTSIEGVSSEVENNDIYSVSGQYMGKDSKRLQRGVYIVNGKKVVKK